MLRPAMAEHLNPSNERHGHERWGAMARKHWIDHLPAEHEALTDAEAFFTQLGEHMAAWIDQISLALEGDDQPGESDLDTGMPTDGCGLTVLRGR